jgi:hypothetical protein
LGKKEGNLEDMVDDGLFAIGCLSVPTLSLDRGKHGRWLPGYSQIVDVLITLMLDQPKALAVGPLFRRAEHDLLLDVGGDYRATKGQAFETRLVAQGMPETLEDNQYPTAGKRLNRSVYSSIGHRRRLQSCKSGRSVDPLDGCPGERMPHA